MCTKFHIILLITGLTGQLEEPPEQQLYFNYCSRTVSVTLVKLLLLVVVVYMVILIKRIFFNKSINSAVHFEVKRHLLCQIHV